jgi:hypothetical protein
MHTGYWWFLSGCTIGSSSRRAQLHEWGGGMKNKTNLKNIITQNKNNF